MGIYLMLCGGLVLDCTQTTQALTKEVLHRAQAEAALRGSKTGNRAVVDPIVDGIITTHPQLSIAAP